MTAIETTLPNPSGEQHESVIDVKGDPTVLRRAGEGRPVLFLHGAFFPKMWLSFHEQLSHSVDLLAPIHPGYSDGIPPTWVSGFEDLVLHYHDLLDAVGVGAADLVAYDLGSWLAAQIATFYPERVRSLTVIAPYGLRVPGQPALEYLGMAPERVTEALFNGDPGEWAAMAPSMTNIARFVEAYATNSMTSRLIWGRRYELRLERWLPRLQVPSLVIAPKEDRIVPAAHAARWAELMPGSRMEVLDGVGHALLAQAPEPVSHLVASFLEEMPA